MILIAATFDVQKVHSGQSPADIRAGFAQQESP